MTKQLRRIRLRGTPTNDVLIFSREAEYIRMSQEKRDIRMLSSVRDTRGTTVHCMHIYFLVVDLCHTNT